ncbi:MAG TPA: YlxR family protein [Acidimicrobiales bacterium]
MCRTRRDDHELVRAARDGDGRWYLGRGTGRGVWWCADSGCGEELQNGQLARSLRTAVSEGDAVALREAWKAGTGPKL